MRCLLQAAQQDVYSSRAAVYLAGGDERKHFAPAPHPAIHAALQDRAALARAESLAVYDSHTRLSGIRVMAQEFAQVFVRFLQRHAVQVDLVLDRVAAARELPHLALTDACARKSQVLDVVQFQVIDVSLQAFGERSALIRTRKTRARFWFSLRWRYSLFAAQRFSIRHCASEQVCFVFTHFYSR